MCTDRRLRDRVHPPRSDAPFEAAVYHPPVAHEHTVEVGAALPSLNKRGEPSTDRATSHAQIDPLPHGGSEVSTEGTGLQGGEEGVEFGEVGALAAPLLFD